MEDFKALIWSFCNVRALKYCFICCCKFCYNRYEAGSTTAVGGIEFTIAARSSVAQDSSLNKAEDKLHAAMDKALQYVMTHYTV